MCLEGLGLQRAGSLLPVLRGAGPLGDPHEEKKVAVVLATAKVQNRGTVWRLKPRGEYTPTDCPSVQSTRGAAERSHRGNAGRGGRGGEVCLEV